MNIIQFLASLSVYLATVNGDLEPELPWVFFAKIAGKLEPLSGKFLGDRFSNMSVFTYGNEAAEPVEFVVQHKYARTMQNGEWKCAGFYQGNFMFGSSLPPQPLQLDLEGRLRPGPFYICNIMGTEARGSLHGIQGKGHHYCFQVDVYLLPYIRETKSAASLIPSFVPYNESHIKGMHVVVEPCRVNYLGSNVHELVEQTWSHSYKDCDVYINGKLQPDRNKVTTSSDLPSGN